jgi:signal transduction histidine kinase
LGSAVSLVTNLVFPFLGYFTYQWMGQIFTIFMVMSVVYAIIRYNLFQIKLLATELFIFLIVGVSIFKIFLSISRNELILNLIFAFILTFFGYLLVKSSIKEDEQKEELQKLNKKITYFNEQLKTLDERKTEFINIASHQLRTPATAIKGYTQLISDGDYGEMSDNVRKQVVRINELADQSLSLITDMLNISRIEENRLVYHFDDVDVNEVVYNIAKSFEPRTKEKGLDYTFIISKDKTILKIDKTLFTQAVENVIDNSVKYTKKGGMIKLTAGIIDLNLNGDMHKVYQFECVDNGIGIDKESQLHLFEKFSRSKNARDSGLDGTGIGMYLAREIIHSHKGEISVTSEGEGKGTRSLITLNVK